MKSKPTILYISSASPIKGPGAIGWRQVCQFKDLGYEVDMLTLYREPSIPEIMYVKDREKKDPLLYRIWNTIIKKISRHELGIPYYFFYKKETHPPLPVSWVTSKITKNYDMVIIYFWQGLLSFKTVEAIYDKLGNPVVFFFSPDYSHMSGGCHFTCGCQGYQTGCGCCPAWNSHNKKDFTHWNVMFRKRFYEKVKPIVFGNTYMNSFYSQSFLLKDVRTVVSALYVDSNVYKPMEKIIVRQEFNIDKDSFVISFGCQGLTDRRKGISLLIDALYILHSKLSAEETNKICLLIAGADSQLIQDKLPFKSICLGYIPLNRLPAFYSAANIFVCSSVDDAGPSMIPQAISCGTPVVGFKMGAMLDYVLNRGTGYCAELKNCSDLASGIESFFRLPLDELEKISQFCRKLVVTQFCYDNKIKQCLDLYQKYK